MKTLKQVWKWSLLLLLIIETLSCSSNHDGQSELVENVTLWDNVVAPYNPVSKESLPSWVIGMINTSEIEYIAKGTNEEQCIYLLSSPLFSTVPGRFYDENGVLLSMTTEESQSYTKGWTWNCIYYNIKRIQ